VALVICWIPILGILAGLAGLVLGIIAWVTLKPTGRPIGLAIAGTIIAGLALLAGILVTILIFWVFDEFGDDIRDCSSSTLTQQQRDQCIEDRINDRFGIDESP